jgi:hypothetical protein
MNIFPFMAKFIYSLTAYYDHLLQFEFIPRPIHVNPSFITPFGLVGINYQRGNQQFSSTGGGKFRPVTQSGTFSDFPMVTAR